MRRILKVTIAFICLTSFVTAKSGSYFTDSVTSPNSFETESPPPFPELMITEVHYDPIRSYKLEWVEIYNTTNTVINFKDWMLSDYPGTTVFHSNIDLPIPPHSFAILAHDKSIKNYFNIPNDVIIIASTSWNIALNNNGDKVLLKDPGGNEIDAMSYGATKNPFSPSCPDVLRGHSLERFDLTVDTDTAADWVDNPSPTPGLPYVP